MMNIERIFKLFNGHVCILEQVIREHKEETESLLITSSALEIGMNREGRALNP
jgi:hypothetical protein